MNKKRNDNRSIVPQDRHPKKKSQKELWSDLLDEGAPAFMITYDGLPMYSF